MVTGLGVVHATSSSLSLVCGHRGRKQDEERVYVTLTIARVNL